MLAERWRVHYNTVRPHSSLGYKPPAPETWLTNSKGHGEVETASRFPLLHAPDGGYLNSEIAAYTNSYTGTKDRILQGSRSERSEPSAIPSRTSSVNHRNGWGGFAIPA